MGEALSHAGDRTGNKEQEGLRPWLLCLGLQGEYQGLSGNLRIKEPDAHGIETGIGVPVSILFL